MLKNPNLKWGPTLTTAGEGNHSVISEKWHYITSKDNVEQLYNLEKDPMEWTNLISLKTPETEAVVKELKAYLPKNEFPEAKGKAGDKEKINGEKGPDMTLKSRRVLNQLK